MGTAALGTLGLVLENLSSPGLVQLYSGPVSASFSLTTQPSGSTGMLLFVVVQGNTTTGTVSIAGTGPGGATPSESTPTIPIQQPGQSVEVTDFEYLTDAVFSTVNASGVTTTGLANAKITIYGLQASKLLIPSMVEMEETPDFYTPEEQRGTLDKNTSQQQLVKKIDISKVEQGLYPENSLYAGYMCVEATPDVVSIPASPTSLKTSAAVSGGPFSLTAQPTAPGMVLIFVVTSSTAVGTIAIAGVNNFGQATSETITASGNGSNGNGTYYSTNVYSAVNASGVSFTGLTGGSVAITGVYGWQYTFTPDNLPLYTAAMEWYSGTDSLGVPFAYFTDLEASFGVDKETTLSLKGGAQDLIPIGDRTTNPMSASRATSLAQPTDLPVVGWQTLAYIDQISSSPLTTSYSQVIEGKVTVSVPRKAIYTATNTQRFRSLSRQKREATLAVTINFESLEQYEAFRKNMRQFIALQLLGDYIGSVSGTLYSKSWTWIFPAQHTKFKRNTSNDENVTVEIESKGILTPSVGYSHRLVVVCQVPPNTFP